MYARLQMSEPYSIHLRGSNCSPCYPNPNIWSGSLRRTLLPLKDRAHTIFLKKDGTISIACFSIIYIYILWYKLLCNKVYDGLVVWVPVMIKYLRKPMTKNVSSLLAFLLCILIEWGPQRLLWALLVSVLWWQHNKAAPGAQRNPCKVKKSAIGWMSFICRLNMAGTHGWTYNIILRSFVHFPISQLLQVYLYYRSTS
jgi:hypothetical protein